MMIYTSVVPIIIGIVIGIAFILCLIGLILSIKTQKKQKALIKKSDYSFEKKHGSYSFKYMIKGFKKDGLQLNIVISPVLGFSDIATGATNGVIEITVKGVNETTKEEVEKTFVIKDILDEMEEENFKKRYAEYEKLVEKDLKQNERNIKYGAITESQVRARHVVPSKKDLDIGTIKKTSNFKLNPTIKMKFPQSFVDQPINVTVTSVWNLGGKVLDNDEVLNFRYEK